MPKSLFCCVNLLLQLVNEQDFELARILVAKQCSSDLSAKRSLSEHFEITTHKENSLEITDVQQVENTTQFSPTAVVPVPQVTSTMFVGADLLLGLQAMLMIFCMSFKGFW